MVPLGNPSFNVLLNVNGGRQSRPLFLLEADLGARSFA